jgi:hypothetical protein
MMGYVYICDVVNANLESLTKGKNKIINRAMTTETAFDIQRTY